MTEKGVNFIPFSIPFSAKPLDYSSTKSHSISHTKATKISENGSESDDFCGLMRRDVFVLSQTSFRHQRLSRPAHSTALPLLRGSRVAVILAAHEFVRQIAASAR